MPIYDLKCVQCEKEYEFFKTQSDQEPQCPSCGSGANEKLAPKNTGVQFKGSGFHVNDYGKRGRKGR